MVPFSFADQEMRLVHGRALFWPRENALLVADLHLEKASFFAGHGQMLPPYDSRETLERVALAVRETGARRVFCLGDNFHDAEARPGWSRMQRACWRRSPARSTGCGSPAIMMERRERRSPTLEIGGLTLRHKAAAGRMSAGAVRPLPPAPVGFGARAADCPALRGAQREPADAAGLRRADRRHGCWRSRDHRRAATGGGNRCAGIGGRQAGRISALAGSGCKQRMRLRNLCPTGHRAPANRGAWRFPLPFPRRFALRTRARPKCIRSRHYSTPTPAHDGAPRQERATFQSHD